MAYSYWFVDIFMLYSDGAVCKYVCGCVGSSFGSVQIFCDAFNFYRYLTANGVIVEDFLFSRRLSRSTFFSWRVSHASP